MPGLLGAFGETHLHWAHVGPETTRDVVGLQLLRLLSTMCVLATSTALAEQKPPSAPVSTPAAAPAPAAKPKRLTIEQAARLDRALAHIRELQAKLRVYVQEADAMCAAGGFTLDRLVSGKVSVDFDSGEVVVTAPATK